MSSENTLRLFCKVCGPMKLEQVTVRTVAAFLDASSAQVTKCSKFSAVKCFVEHCAGRGLMPKLHLTPPAKPAQYRAPFIFTQAQIRAMLQATDRCQARAFDFDGKTLRMVVLLLYATGASRDEVLSLRASDVDVRKQTLLFAGTISKPQRLLPIGEALSDELTAYLAFRRESAIPAKCNLLLTSRSGKPLGRTNLSERFKRLQRSANSANPGNAQRGMGRIQDLRYTFAVHRLKAWIAEGKDLTKLLPALSSYMGYASLVKSEEFLAFTPERFHADLRKLAVDQRVPAWKEDCDLMDFLSRL